MKLFILVDIGCIECGESTEVFVYKTRADAEKKEKELDALGWRGGQHNYEIFEVEV